MFTNLCCCDLLQLLTIPHLACLPCLSCCSRIYTHDDKTFSSALLVFSYSHPLSFEVRLIYSHKMGLSRGGREGGKEGRGTCTNEFVVAAASSLSCFSIISLFLEACLFHFLSLIPRGEARSHYLVGFLSSFFLVLSSLHSSSSLLWWWWVELRWSHTLPSLRS